ncbi:hypothetical protein [Caenimonas soli]|uniref:hypothetical protein n=1 Tax=Caenimonas soli TaxID=2735555 RepID=UPI0015553C7E|nr:hypothetical protein [Caenimonas soli]NPC57808.1 hypothetical protein [Caenimonas soli]
MALLRQCLNDLRRHTHDIEGLVVVDALQERTTRAAWLIPYERSLLRDADGNNGATNQAVALWGRDDSRSAGIR